METIPKDAKPLVIINGVEMPAPDKSWRVARIMNRMLGRKVMPSITYGYELNNDHQPVREKLGDFAEHLRRIGTAGLAHLGLSTSETRVDEFSQNTVAQSIEVPEPAS